MNRVHVGAACACALVALLAASCGDYPAPAASANACAVAPPAGAHAVTCPGVAGCACAAPSVCCLSAIDAKNGACGDPRTCPGIELTCDGPEDCTAGAVCCLTSTGSSCASPTECTGSWLCRSDAQCAGSPGGGTCTPADFGQQGVVDKGLDGLIGICRQ